MSQSVDRHLVIQELFTRQSSVPVHGHEEQHSPCEFSQAKESVSQENKDITTNNNRECRVQKESPFKLHNDSHKWLSPKRCTDDAADNKLTPISNIDVHPGGGHWSPAISERLDNTLVIFDWDDTIFPSSYLALLDVDYNTDVIPKCLKDRIFILETHVLELFDLVISLVGESRVYIITNAAKGWITLSGQKFMPRLLNQLCQCNIISARSTFEPFSPFTGPFEWKLLAFHMAAETLFGSRFPKPIVYVMKPWQVYVPDEERHRAKELEGIDRESSEDVSNTSSEVDSPSTDQRTDSDGSTETGDKSIVQFSKDCLTSGDDEITGQAVSLCSSAAGNHDDTYGTPSMSSNFHNFPSSRVEMVWMPCNELVNFPEVPVDFLKLSGFDYVPAEDIEKVLESQKFIVSLGDSLAEKIATQNIAQAMPNTVTKTLKYMDRPNLDQLVTETILVRNHIREYLEMSQAMDIMINIPEHDMTSFERQYRTQKAEFQN